jgi:hypothetical protein
MGNISSRKWQSQHSSQLVILSSTSYASVIVCTEVTIAEMCTLLVLSRAVGNDNVTALPHHQKTAQSVTPRSSILFFPLLSSCSFGWWLMAGAGLF